MKDKHGNSIRLGDILDSDDGYSVIVSEYRVPGEVAQRGQRYEGGGWYGKLICEPSHSYAEIPYAINEGRGYTKREGRGGRL